MPPLDPSKDFRDDGGTPAWQARHTIEIYPSRWAAARAYARRHPEVYLSIGAIFLLMPIWLPIILVAALIAWDLLCRLFSVL